MESHKSETQISLITQLNLWFTWSYTPRADSGSPAKPQRTEWTFQLLSSQAGGKSVPTVLSSPLVTVLFCTETSRSLVCITHQLLICPFPIHYGAFKLLHILASKPSLRQGSLWQSRPVMEGQPL